MSAGLVAQHQQTSFATPINGAAGDATVVLGNDNATVTTYNTHDSDGTIHLQSSTAATFAAIPAGTAGRKWMTTDGLRIFYDTGSVWSEAAYLPLVGGTVAGATTFSAGISITTGGITVVAGTSALQAITGTTLVLTGGLSGVTTIAMAGELTGATAITVSGLIDSTMTSGTVFRAATATTGGYTGSMSNSAGDIAWGVAANAGTGPLTGMAANVGFIGCTTNHALHFGTNGATVAILSAAGAWRWTTYGAGTLTTDGSGNITAVSDERVKDRITVFGRGLEALRGIAPILHGYTEASGLDREHLYVGFSAQNVRQSIPETIFEKGGLLSLSDRGILAALVNAVKELDRRCPA